MISEKLVNFLKRLTPEDVKGERTHGTLKEAAKGYLGNRRHYEEYETFELFGHETDVHHILLSLIYDNI